MSNTENQTLVATSENSEITVLPEEGDIKGTHTEMSNEDGVGRISVTGTSEDAGNPNEPRLTMPEKFANAENPQEALLKAYTELEKMQGKQTTENTSQNPEAGDKTAAEKAMEEINSDRTKADAVRDYSEMWAKEGKLTDDQWNTLSGTLGMNVDTLKAFEAYQKAELGKQAEGVNTNDQAIYQASGGQEAYDRMIDWANTKMSDAQIDALNAQLDNPQFSAMGVNMLKQMYIADVGQEPTKSTIDGASVQGGLDSMFHSDQEWIDAQKHPEYGKGGRYDKEFDLKLTRYMKSTGQL